MASNKYPYFLPYGKQTLSEQDRKAVFDALSSDWITSGPLVSQFEDDVCAYTGAKYAVAVNSGTAALDIAIGALNLPEGSEIITTPFTWISTVNAILFNKMVPVLADIDPQTYNLDPKSVRSKIGPKTKAILCIDYAGNPADISAFRKLADEFNLYLLEDAAQSFSASYHKRRVGNLDADMTTFSFHPVKHITTGEGGMVTTNSELFANRLRMLRNHGVTKSFKDRMGDSTSIPSFKYDVQFLSKNYRITDFQCALGSSQLTRSDEFLEKRTQIAKRYHQAFANEPLLTLPQETADAKSAWHIYPILLDPSISRDVFFAKLREANIGVNVHHMPAYSFSYHLSKFAWKASDYPVCETVYSRTITLPIYPLLTIDEQEFIIKTVLEMVSSLSSQQ